MDYAEKAMELHRKLEMHTRTETGTREALSIAYTPGVAAPCLAIKEDPAQSYELTRRWNTVAVVTDGTAVLGLGDIGPEAGMPVMEGKCILWGDRIFEKCGIRRDEEGDGGKTLEIRGKRRLSARDGGANYQQS